MLSIIFAILAMVGNIQMDVACSLPPPEPGLITYDIISDGLEREFIVFIPGEYDPSEPTPLVLTLHGFGDNAESFIQVSNWTRVANDYGFLLVAPQGYRNRWNAGVIPNNQIIDDIGFLEAVIGKVQASYCVDASRIYLNGFSNGGGMTEHFACAMTDRVAAIGTVSGAYHPLLEACAPSRPLPLIAFHGVQDTVVPYNGQDSNFLALPAIEDWLASWVSRNDCTEDAERLVISETLSETVYDDCADDVEIVFYALADGGHAWPGGQHRLPFLAAQTNREINASEVMWTFFSQFALPTD